MPAFPRPGWHDVADILILGYFVHRAILLARGTRAPHVLVALAALWLLGEVARRAGLELTGWFIEAIKGLAPIALIVVFRNEIRDALVRSGPLRLLAGRPARPGAIDPSTVAEAAFRLAASRTGALLVFQGRDRLDGLAREGTRIDARFSVPLVESLFAKESPVHDGAAILRDGRIDRVGTFLPLSIRDGLPTEFGTRHRAAVGLSELCDAIVLVVSEERGEVSMVRRGQVELIASPEALERALGGDLGARGEAAPRRVRVPELAASAAGFLLTVLAVGALWGLFNLQQVAQRTVTVSVNFSGLRDSLELIGPPESIDLQVRGNRTLIDGLAPERLTASVDLSGAERGGRFAIEPGDVSLDLPAGVDWSLADPSLYVELDERVVVMVPVRPRLEREPPGLALASPRAEPSTVSINVPRRQAGQLKTVETRPIDVSTLGLNAARREVTVEVRLELGRIAARPARGASDTVRVTVGLRPAEAPAAPKAAP